MKCMAETAMLRSGRQKERMSYLPRIVKLLVSEEEICATLADGRRIAVPLAWSWRLAEATPQQRANFRIIGDGQGVHWPDIDEDISAWGMLHGAPAYRNKQTA